MSSKHVLRIAAALLVALFLWRVIAVETDLATLRDGVAKTRAAAPPGSTGARREIPPITPVEAPRGSVISARANDPKSANPTGHERAVEELQLAKERIAELEATVKELSDAWNQFATEEETKRVMAERLEQIKEENRRGAARLHAELKQSDGAARLNARKAWEEQQQAITRALADYEMEFSKFRK